MGGEHGSASIHPNPRLGSSPRGRGTLLDVGGLAACCRIIPAWAGNTDTSTSIRSGMTDHPRVGGEHAFSKESRTGCIGSSPRGRGTPPKERLRNRNERIIPAWAGNTAIPFSTRLWIADHPRVGGEHVMWPWYSVKEAGSSPRGRGTHAPLLFKGNDFWIIPAWAGNTSRALAGSLSGADHPRVGGEHIPSRKITESRPGSSPRGRGTLSG